MKKYCIGCGKELRGEELKYESCDECFKDNMENIRDFEAEKELRLWYDYLYYR